MNSYTSTPHDWEEQLNELDGLLTLAARQAIDENPRLGETIARLGAGQSQLGQKLNGRRQELTQRDRAP